MGKSLIWIGLGAMAGYLLFWGAPKFFEDNGAPGSLARLQRIAAELNRSVPMMIDKETELTVVEAHEGMLIYRYRLVPYSVRQLDHQRFAAGVKQKVTQSACNEPQLQEDFLKQKVTLRYSYLDKDKQHIATIDVTPADCGF